VRTANASAVVLTWHPSIKRTSFDLVALLASNLKRRGFQCGHLLALRAVSQGVEQALSTILLAFWFALDETEGEWSRRLRSSRRRS